MFVFGERDSCLGRGEEGGDVNRKEIKRKIFVVKYNFSSFLLLIRGTDGDDNKKL